MGKPVQINSDNLVIELIKGERNGIWDRFVKSCPNFTFYQSSDFLDYYSFKVDSLHKIVFKKKNKIIASIPGGIINKGGLKFYSPFSASFGGFCYIEGSKLEDVFAMIRGLNDYLKLNNIAEAIIRQTPLIYSKRLDEYIDFALLCNGYALDRTELTLYMDAINCVTAKVKQNIRKAERSGLVFSEEDSIEEVYKFISFHKKKKNITFSVTSEDLIYLKNLFPGHIKTFSVSYKNKIIAAIITYFLNDICVLGFNWEQDEQYQEYRPTDLMIYKTANWIFNSGYRFFDLGTVTLEGKPNLGLSRFKENFGTNGVIRKTFVKKIK